MKQLLCLLALGIGVNAQITPTAPMVTAGGTVALTHTGGSVSWTLSGVGSISASTGSFIV